MGLFYQNKKPTLTKLMSAFFGEFKRTAYVNLL